MLHMNIQADSYVILFELRIAEKYAFFSIIQYELKYGLRCNIEIHVHLYSVR